MSNIYFKKCQKYTFKNVKNIFSKMSKMHFQKYILKNVKDIKNINIFIYFLMKMKQAKDNQKIDPARHIFNFNQSGHC